MSGCLGPGAEVGAALELEVGRALPEAARGRGTPWTEYWRRTSEVRRPCSARAGGVSSVEAVEEGAGPADSGVSQKM